MTRFLITGGSGYIAQFVLDALVKTRNDGDDVFYVTYSQHEWIKSYNNNITGVHLDLASPASIAECMQTARPDVVVHCAAMTSLAQCEKNPDLCRQVNVLGPQQILTGHNPHFVFLSTDQVYSGALIDGYYQEEDVDQAINVYGRSKREFEVYLEGKKEQHGRWTVLRLSNVIGPSSPPFQPAAPPGKFLQFVRQQLSSNSVLEMWDNETRCFVSVLDVARAVCEVVRGAHFGVFNCGGGEALTRVEFAHLVQQAGGGGKEKKLIVGKPNPSPISPHNLAMDSSKLARLVFGSNAFPPCTETMLGGFE